MPTTAPTRTAELERVHIAEGTGTSFWLWRRDLELLRALYRGQPGGYSIHIRAAVNAMCNVLRAELAKTPPGCDLLRRLNQEPPNV